MRRAFTILGEVLVIGFVLALLAGQVLGQPILLGFVETGSMAPTLEAGDGFIAVPTAIAGGVAEGDVVVFEAAEIQGGGLTTHRVVGETDRGYLTRGDANPFTDQDGDEPPVKDAQIVATALQLGGSVVVIPNLGTVVMGFQDVLAGLQRWLAVTLGTRSLLGTQGIAYLLLALSGFLYVADLLLSDGRRERFERDRARDTGYSMHLILIGLALLLVGTATAAMMLPAGPQEFGIVSAEFDSEDPTVIPQGESSSIEYLVPNAGIVPVHAYLEPGSEGVAIEPTHVYVGSRGEATAEVTFHAPADTGYYRRFVVEHRYLAILPERVITGLYGVHTWLPIVVIDAILGGGVYLIGLAMVGRGRIRVRNRTVDRSRSAGARLEGWLFGSE